MALIDVFHLNKMRLVGRILLHSSAHGYFANICTQRDLHRRGKKQLVGEHCIFDKFNYLTREVTGIAFGSCLCMYNAQNWS